MIKKKKSRSAAFSLGDTSSKGALPTKEEVLKTVEKVTPKSTAKKAKRIPFTTALTPQNRALLETASHQSQQAIADILNEAIGYYFEEKRPINNEAMLATFLKIYSNKSK